MNAHLKILISLIAGVLFCGILMTSCKKDSNTSDDNSGNDDNLFIGTWYSTEYEDVTVDFTSTKWKMEEDGYVYYSGTYTYNGKTATLKVTYSDDGDEIGEKATAKISGKKLTVTDWDGDVFEFSKDNNSGGDDDDDDDNGDVQVRFKKEEPYTVCLAMGVIDIDGNNSITEVWAEHEFGEAAGVSKYYEIPSGVHYPAFVDDEGDIYLCLKSPYTYNFKQGHKYTIVCGDDGTYLTFSVVDDGTFKRGETSSSPANINHKTEHKFSGNIQTSIKKK